jgi:hypothetical protein
MNHTTPQPEFIRLPRRGQCPHSGLSRSYLIGLILPNQENGNNPPVRSVCLRKAGRLRGVRLISLPSLIDYVNGQEGVSP